MKKHVPYKVENRVTTEYGFKLPTRNNYTAVIVVMPVHWVINLWKYFHHVEISFYLIMQLRTLHVVLDNSIANILLLS